MKPVNFKESNITFAKNQKEYLPLPAWKNREGNVVSCWKMTFWERVKILVTGKIWLNLLSFNRPLTPHRIYSDNPIKYFSQETDRLPKLEIEKTYSKDQISAIIALSFKYFFDNVNNGKCVTKDELENYINKLL